MSPRATSSYQVFFGVITEVFGGAPGDEVPADQVSYSAEGYEPTDPRNVAFVEQEFPVRGTASIDAQGVIGPGLNVLIAKVGSPVTIVATQERKWFTAWDEKELFGPCGGESAGATGGGGLLARVFGRS